VCVLVSVDSPNLSQSDSSLIAPDGFAATRVGLRGILVEKGSTQILTTEENAKCANKKGFCRVARITRYTYCQARQEIVA